MGNSNDDKIKPFGGDGKTIRDVLEDSLRFWKKDKVQRVVRTSESILTIFLNNKKNTPLSLSKVGLQVSTELLSFYESTSTSAVKMSPVWNAYNNHKDECQTVVLSYLAVLFLPYLDDSKLKVEEKEDTESNSSNKGNILYSYELSEDETMYWVDNNVESSNIICSGNLEKAKSLLAKQVWENYNNHIEVNIHEDSGEFEFHNKSLLPWRYEGDQGPRLINRWKKFYDANIRRSVILHGPPGTGKSTLAKQAAKELEGRVLFVPVRILKAVNNIKYFTSTLEALQPDILIIDDIDRLSQVSLELLLGFFEETETKVPLLIATTNHLSRLPSAIKRPGRFDEIWGISPPDDDIRIRVIMYLAELENVRLTEEQAEYLSEVASHENLPGSHIREIIRRIAVLGWEEAVSFTDDDLTFDAEWMGTTDPFDVIPGTEPEGKKSSSSIDKSTLNKPALGKYVKKKDECKKGLKPKKNADQISRMLDDLEEDS